MFSLSVAYEKYIRSKRRLLETGTPSHLPEIKDTYTHIHTHTPSPPPPMTKSSKAEKIQQSENMRRGKQPRASQLALNASENDTPKR